MPHRGPTTPTLRYHSGGLGCSPVARHYWGNHVLFSLPGGTKMFQFPPFASPLSAVMTVLQTDGLSHSEIRGSQVICTSPRLIAAYHVLHRLHEPRHPPCALFFFNGSVHKIWTAHTFSSDCIKQFTSFLSFTLQFRVAICQRSLRNVRPLPEHPEVENNGFEPLTPCLQSRCSSQLS